MKKIIITPTYNERKNLEKLIKQVFDLKIDNLDILVVDDNSPDGTGELAENLKSKYPNLEVLHRDKKEGLGRAYVDAFKYVLKKDYNLMMHMDADLSHNPKYIPDFFEKIKECDLVLGSRYIKGGGVENWNWARRIISRFGNLYARTILGLPYHDLTGGYKCYRREVLKKINLDNLNSIGYCFLTETTYRVHQAGFKILETPIIFTERTEGKSKFNIAIIIESFINVLLLRIRK